MDFVGVSGAAEEMVFRMKEEFGFSDSGVD